MAGTCHQNGDNGEDEHGHLLGAEVGLVELGGVLVEAAGLAVLLGEGLDHADARQGVVHHGVHGGGAPPLVGVALPELGQGEFQDQHHGDDGGVEDEGQLPVHAEQENGQHDVGQDVADEVGHAVDEEAADALGVVIDAVDELTRRIGVEVGEGQPLHGAEDVVLHVSRHAGGEVGVGAVLDDTDAHGEKRHARQHAHPDIHVLCLVHKTRQLLSRHLVKGGGSDDLIEEDATADDGVQKGQSRGGQEAEQNHEDVLLEDHEVAHEPPHDTLLVDAMLTDTIAGIAVHPSALGAGTLELVEDAVIVGNLLPAIQPLPKAYEGQELQLDAVGAVAQHHGGTAARVGLLGLAELLVGQLSLLGGQIVLGVEVDLEAVGGGVVIDVGSGHAGEGEGLHPVADHAVDISIRAGVDQPHLAVVSLHVLIQFQAHIGGGGVDAVGF